MTARQAAATANKRGRRARGFRKDGQRNKRFRWNCELVDEAGLRLSVLTMLDTNFHDEAEARLQVRIGQHFRLHDPKWETPTKQQVMQAPSSASWLRQEHFSIGCDKPNKGGARCMPLSCKLVTHGTKSTRKFHDEPQLLAWVNFVRDARFALSFDKNRGLGVRSVAGAGHTFKMGESLLGGYEELDFATAHYTTAGRGGVRGTTFGPLSLVNAGCSVHANVRFNSKFSAVVAMKPAVLATGTELLANYAQGDAPLTCAFPGCTTCVRGPS